MESGTRELTSDLLLESLYLRREGGVGGGVEIVRDAISAVGVEDAIDETEKDL